MVLLYGMKIVSHTELELHETKKVVVVHVPSEVICLVTILFMNEKCSDMVNIRRGPKYS